MALRSRSGRQHVRRRLRVLAARAGRIGARRTRPARRRAFRSRRLAAAADGGGVSAERRDLRSFRAGARNVRAVSREAYRGVTWKPTSIPEIPMRIRLPALALLASLSLSTRDMIAQAAPAAASTPVPAARPQDVASVDAIIAALYDVISGPAGQKRDWDRFRSLFGPGARLIPTGRRPDGTAVMRVQTPEEYAASAATFFDKNGFFEREIGRRTEPFGNVLHVFSAYDSKRAASDTAPFARGIN